MTKQTLLIWGLGLAFCGLQLAAVGGFAEGAAQAAESARAEQKEGAKKAPEGKVLRHVVLFKFKAESPKEKIDEIIAAFGALPSKIDGIVDFEWGTDVSPEQKAQGFTHCFLVTFATEKGRDDYLPHPAHKEFVKLVGPHLADVLVVDYWSRK